MTDAAAGLSQMRLFDPDQPPPINPALIRTKNDMQAVALMLSAGSHILESRLNLAGQMSSFDGQRDIPRQLGYKRGDPTWEDYQYIYERKDVFGAAVDKLTGSTWARLLRVEIGNDDGAAFQKVNMQICMIDKFLRVDRLATLGHYAVLMFGITDKTIPSPEQQRGNEYIKALLKTELTGKHSLENLSFIQAFSEKSAALEKFGTDPFSPTFNRPIEYKIQIHGPETNNAARPQPFMVHASRCVHITEGGLESEIIGRPIYKRLYDRFHDYEKIVGGGAEMWWQGASPMIHANVPAEARMVAPDTDALREQLAAFYHGLQRYISTQGVDLQRFAPATPDMGSAFEVIASVIAAGFQIPKRILFGSERGELASGQDEKNYDAMIGNRCKGYAEPCVVLPVVRKMQEIGVLPDGEIRVEWEEQSLLGEIDRADVASKKANALKDVSLDGDTDEVATVEERREMLGLPRERPAGSAKRPQM